MGWMEKRPPIYFTQFNENCTHKAVYFVCFPFSVTMHFYIRDVGRNEVKIYTSLTYINLQGVQ